MPLFIFWNILHGTNTSTKYPFLGPYDIELSGSGGLREFSVVIRRVRCGGGASWGRTSGVRPVCPGLQHVPPAPRFAAENDAAEAFCPRFVVEMGIGSVGRAVGQVLFCPLTPG